MYQYMMPHDSYFPQQARDSRPPPPDSYFHHYNWHQPRHASNNAQRRNGAGRHQHSHAHPEPPDSISSDVSSVSRRRVITPRRIVQSGSGDAWAPQGSVSYPPACVLRQEASSPNVPHRRGGVDRGRLRQPHRRYNPYERANPRPDTKMTTETINGGEEEDEEEEEDVVMSDAPPDETRSNGFRQLSIDSSTHIDTRPCIARSKGFRQLSIDGIAGIGSECTLPFWPKRQSRHERHTSDSTMDETDQVDGLWQVFRGFGLNDSLELMSEAEE